MSICLKHLQQYNENSFCVYCGNPQEKKIAQTSTGYNTSNACYCTCDETKTYNDCALHGKKGQNPLAA